MRVRSRAISGATSTTLSTGATTAGESGTKYEAVFTNAFGSTTTSAATLTVSSAVVFGGAGDRDAAGERDGDGAGCGDVHRGGFDAGQLCGAVGAVAVRGAGCELVHGDQRRDVDDSVDRRDDGWRVGHEVRGGVHERVRFDDDERGDADGQLPVVFGGAGDRDAAGERDGDGAGCGDVHGGGFDAGNCAAPTVQWQSDDGGRDSFTRDQRRDVDDAVDGRDDALRESGTKYEAVFTNRSVRRRRARRR